MANGQWPIDFTRSRRCGPRRARTVTSLRAGELHCLSCSGPVVRGTGVEPVMPEGAWVTARCRPETASRGRIGVGTRARAWRGPDPLIGDLFSFQGAISARRVRSISKYRRVTPAGVQGIEPRP